MRFLNNNYIMLIRHISLLLMTLVSVQGRIDSPNIILIVADDLGISDLGCYGSEFYQTPTLDAFSEEGIRFDRAYSASTVCSPTRASILTGLYPHRIQMTDALPWDRLFFNPKMIPPNHIKDLPARLPSFAKIFQNAGYETALYGKWHLGNEDTFFAKNKHQLYGFNLANDVTSKEKKSDKGVKKLTKFACNFIKKNKNRPFLLCIMHHTPHVPLACPESAEALYRNIPRGQHQKNSKYAGMVTYMDHSIKILLDQLRILGLEKNTIVVFTSDNGGLKNVTANHPYRGGKGDLYEGGIRVPLMIRWPHKIKPHSVSDFPVQSMDFFATFLDLAGLNTTKSIETDGISLLPLLEGKELEARDLFWHFPHRERPSSAILHRNSKLIYKIETEDYELYDLADDPHESNNLARQNPEQAKNLALLLEAHLKSTGAQRMRVNPNWDPSKPRGKIRNFGSFYPLGGRIYRQVNEPYPVWFHEN